MNILYKFIGFILVSSSIVNAAVTPRSFKKWKKNEISVCWWSPEVKLPKMKELDSALVAELILKKDIELEMKSSNYKNRVQDVIQDHYNQQSIGIDFTGWSNCKSNNKIDLTIIAINRFFPKNAKSLTPDDFSLLLYLYNKGKHKSQIGRKAGGNHMILIDSQFENAHENFNLETLALHEFAHTLGLQHEQFREEALEDPACLIESTLRNKIKKGNPKFESEWKKRKFVSSYDSHSIMNECHTEIFLNYPLRAIKYPNTPKTLNYKALYDSRFSNDQISPSKIDIKSLRKINYK